MTVLSVRVEGAEPIAGRFQRAPAAMRELFEANFITLGRTTATVMRDQIRVKSYTGKLERSVSEEYQAQPPTVRIGPTAEHAVKVMEGTEPHWEAIEPLKAWAAWKFGDARLAYPVQKKISLAGTEAHDFIEMALMDGRFQAALTNTAERLGIGLVAKLEKD